MIGLAELPDVVLEAMRRHVEVCYPEEGCGVVFLEHGQLDARACLNVHRNAQHSFLIGPSDMRAIAKRIVDGAEIAVIYHSHVDRVASFSELDRHYARAYPGALHVVFGVTDRGVITQRAYRADGTQIDAPAMEPA